jgi:hypothetical protein
MMMARWAAEQAALAEQRLVAAKQRQLERQAYLMRAQGQLVAACARDHLDVVLQTLKYYPSTIDEPSVDPKNSCVHSALFAACMHGSTSCVEALLSSGAALDHFFHGYTALMISACVGHVDCAMLLCAYGANRFLEDQFGHRRADSLARNAADAFDDDGDYDERAERRKLNQLAIWLCHTVNYTPLHYIEVISAERTNALLRAGFSPATKVEQLNSIFRQVSPQMLAEMEEREFLEDELYRAESGRARHEDSVPNIAGTSSGLVLLDVRGWSCENRHLMSAAARERVEALAWVGRKSPLPLDPWNTIVLPRLLRAEFGVLRGLTYRPHGDVSRWYTP